MDRLVPIGACNQHSEDIVLQKPILVLLTHDNKDRLTRIRSQCYVVSSTFTSYDSNHDVKHSSGTRVARSKF
jgi:hypothetical protein